MTQRTTTIAVRLGRAVLGVLVITLLVAPEAIRFSGAADVHRLEPTAARARRFKIAGRVTGLYPGARKSMRLKIANPNRYKIKVSRVTVAIKDSDIPGCTREWVKPKRRLRLSLLVPARARAFVKLPVTMSAAAPNACQRARWPLRFSGRAVRKR